MKKLILLFIFFIMLNSAALADYLSVDTFDDQTRPNNLGGHYGPWMLNWDDPSQSCQMRHEPIERVGSWGGSLKIIYDVESKNKSACGYFTVLDDVDLSKYDRLILYVKGDYKRGYTERFQIEIATPTEDCRYLVSGVNDRWQRFVIPFDNFTRISDWSKVSKLAVVIEDDIVTNKEGAIFIDDIYFSDSEKPM